MRLRIFASVLALLSMSACAGQITIVKNKPRPVHSVHGPVASLKIPPGHYPPPGHCRVWIPGRPPGHQAASVPCGAVHDVPLGAWVLHRPGHDKKVVQVSVYDEKKPRNVVSVAFYDVKSGKLLRTKK